MVMSGLITISDAAASRVKALMGRADKPVLGIRVGVKNTGCSGLSYTIEYAEEKKPLEEVIEDKGVKIFIDPTAVMYLAGTEMDFEEDKLRAGFVFNNPNEKGRCGCGESFRV